MLVTKLLRINRTKYWHFQKEQDMSDVMTPNLMKFVLAMVRKSCGKLRNVATGKTTLKLIKCTSILQITVPSAYRQKQKQKQKHASVYDSM